jgi:hypothetical protein
MLPVHRRVQVVIYLSNMASPADMVARSVASDHRLARSNRVSDAQ